MKDYEAKQTVAIIIAILLLIVVIAIINPDPPLPSSVGVLSPAWPVVRRFGFAGGLGPDTVLQQLQRMAEACEEGAFRQV